jgi:hypothetical protein
MTPGGLAPTRVTGRAGLFILIKSRETFPLNVLNAGKPPPVFQNFFKIAAMENFAHATYYFKYKRSMSDWRAFGACL